MKLPLIFDIQRASFVDGPGIRTVIFLKGCGLDCAWCHNPEGKAAGAQTLFYRTRCTACGACVAVCPAKAINADYSIDRSKCVACGACAEVCFAEAKQLCGRHMTVREVADVAARDIRFYSGTGGGVTFSGGECMLYPEFVAEVAAELKRLHIHVAVDTAGNVPWESFERVLPYVDLFLYDLKHVSSERHRAGTGSGNELILENLDRLCSAAPGKLTIRVPVIPGFNDDAESVRAIRAFLDSRPAIRSVEPLCYHRLGVGKAEAVGRVPFDAENISAERFAEIKSILTSPPKQDAPPPPDNRHHRGA